MGEDKDLVSENEKQLTTEELEKLEAKRKYQREYMKEYAKTDKCRLRRNAARRERYKNDEEYREKEKAKRKKCSAKDETRRGLKRKIKEYDISYWTLICMMECQEARCAICGVHNGERKLFIDHCHETGAVRGLLCENCNFGLGHFKDDPQIIKRAFIYAEDFVNNGSDYHRKSDCQQLVEPPKWQIKTQE